MSKLRTLLLIAVIPLPQPLKQAVYRWLGWKIGKRVKIGLSYIEGAEITLGDNVTIGHFNIFKQLKRLRIGNNTLIFNFNEFFGTNYGPEWAGELIIGEDVHFISHHFIDAAGSVVIGDRSVIAGRETQFWSHQLGIMEGASRLMPLAICVGEDAYIGARAMLLGCSIPAGTVVGAGSVVTRSFVPESCRLLIAGNPAEIKKRYEAKAGTGETEQAVDSGASLSDGIGQ